MNAKDQRVIRAMGSRYEQFRVLAKLAYSHPATRKDCERQMQEILERMSVEERLELRAALVAAKERA